MVWKPKFYLQELKPCFIALTKHDSDSECFCPTGELYITTKAYKAVEKDELTLESGEIIEVIHKLLDGWWVVR